MTDARNEQKLASDEAQTGLGGVSREASMHICLICMELFGFGSTGGFGRATRMIGRELVKRGHRVSVVIRQSARSQERRIDFMLEGMRVRLYSPRRPASSIALYRDCQADLYHSQNPSLATVLAMLAAPRARHIVTFINSRDRGDPPIDRRVAHLGMRARLMRYLQIDNPLVRAAVRRMRFQYADGYYVADKAMRYYRLATRPALLPTPVVVPARVEKAARPTVCFIARWHGIKQPEHFLDLAQKFPAVDFIAVGSAPDQAHDADLRQRYGGIRNLEMTGFIDQFSSDRLSRILSKSWILVNSSLREGLPHTFIEAAAHRCAILSYLDPDGFASRFGQLAHPGELAAGLSQLLQDDTWRARGEAGFEYVRDLYSVEASIDRHIEVYRRALSTDRFVPI